jgi:hypothetical protein
VVLVETVARAAAEQHQAQAEKAYTQDQLMSVHQGKDTMVEQALVLMVRTDQAVVVVEQVVQALHKVLAPAELV